MSQPDLSVLMVGRGPRADLRSTLQHLLHQSARERFEVVLVTDAPDALASTLSEVAEDLDVRVVAVPPIFSSGTALAAGVRSARAPVIAYAEEHAFPEPGWAAALIEAHTGPWAVVSAVMSNANPRSAVSRAHLFLAFGPWIEPVHAGVAPRAASHNCAYKRDILLSYGDSLRRILDTEEILQGDLWMHGHQLYVEPAARVAHLNVSRLAPFLAVEFNGGRIFGAARAEWGRWSSRRRIVYTAGSPLVPFLRMIRLRHALRRVASSSPWSGQFGTLLFAGVIAHSLGEAVGYVAGRGHAGQHMCSFELERRRYLSAADAALPLSKGAQG